jgi:hypothetical protein
VHELSPWDFFDVSIPEGCGKSGVRLETTTNQRLHVAKGGRRFRIPGSNLHRRQMRGLVAVVLMRHWIPSSLYHSGGYGASTTEVACLMDEPEFEITDIGQQPSSDPYQHRRFPGLRLAGRWRLVLAAVSFVVALTVLVSVWLPLHTAEPTTFGSPSPTPRPTATAVLLPTPLPVIGKVDPPPQNCPGTPALDTITVPAFDGFIGSTVQMSGRAPATHAGA